MKLQRWTQDLRQVCGTPEPAHCLSCPMAPRTAAILTLAFPALRRAHARGVCWLLLACGTITPQQGQSGVVTFCEQGAGQAAKARYSNKVELKPYGSRIFRSLREEEAEGLHY